jgi:hypothetical protein
LERNNAYLIPSVCDGDGDGGADRVCN